MSTFSAHCTMITANVLSRIITEYTLQYNSYNNTGTIFPASLTADHIANLQRGYSLNVISFFATAVTIGPQKLTGF